MCYGIENTVFILFALKSILHAYFITLYSYPYVQWTMYWSVFVCVFVLPLRLSWMGLFCTMLWLLSGFYWVQFYLFALQLSSLCHLGEVSFIWTYLCGNKVDHNHLLLTFYIFCMWALTSICPMVPFCKRLHIKAYFTVLSLYLGSQYSLSLWNILGWLCRNCAVHLLAIPIFFLLLYSKVLVSFSTFFFTPWFVQWTSSVLISSLKPN